MVNGVIYEVVAATTPADVAAAAGLIVTTTPASEPLLVATGSACNSKRQEPSYVLRALGRTDLEAQSAIRFSFGRQTTAADVEFAAARYRAAVGRLRDLAPGAAA